MVSSNIVSPGTREFLSPQKIVIELCDEPRGMIMISSNKDPGNKAVPQPTSGTSDHWTSASKRLKDGQTLIFSLRPAESAE
jgi:hypothetical protein